MNDQLLTVRDIESALNLGHTKTHELISAGEIETFSQVSGSSCQARASPKVMETACNLFRLTATICKRKRTAKRNTSASSRQHLDTKVSCNIF